jgi:hypothetical protein
MAIESNPSDSDWKSAVTERKRTRSVHFCLELGDLSLNIGHGCNPSDKQLRSLCTRTLLWLVVVQSYGL